MSTDLLPIQLNPEVDLHPDLDLHLAAQENVQGLHGRKKLQTENKQNKNWMDVARREVATYEYLCHVGEAKE